MKFQSRLLLLGMVSASIFAVYKIFDSGILRGHHIQLLDADYVNPNQELPDERYMGRVDKKGKQHLGAKHLKRDAEEAAKMKTIQKESESASLRAIIDSMIELHTPVWGHKINHSWDVAATWVSTRNIWSKSMKELGAVLSDMNKADIIHADVFPKGTQLKLALTLRGGQKVVFKPMWYARHNIIKGKPFDGKDRHNGEIAAFHLQRILGYNRSPLVVGRIIDLGKEILPVASERLKKTFFRRHGSTCFYGKCYYCKGERDGVCASGSLLEGALVLWLPSPYNQYEKKVHPWIRKYGGKKKAQWEVDPYYCSEVRKKDKIYTHLDGPRILDIVDTAILDYLIGNADRHHYEVFKNFNESMLIIFDSAKSFGNPDHDEFSILAPLYQCCRVRKNTYDQLQLLVDGVMATVLRAVLRDEPVAPILVEPHYAALNRRLRKVMASVDECIQEQREEVVLVSELPTNRHV